MIMITPTLTDRGRALVARLWQLEPVRTALAPLILAAVVAGLVRAGVDGSVAGIVATVVLGGLGFTAQEIARARVVPVPRRDVEVRDAVRSTVDAARDSLESTAVQWGPEIAQQITTTAREYIGQHRAGR